MHSFRNNRLRDHGIPLSTVWLLNDIAESKGKQELLTCQLNKSGDAAWRGRGPGARWRFLQE